MSEKSNVQRVIVGLLLSLLMASMDNTIVVTAMPTIVKELQGLDQLVWVSTAYMVAALSGTPIFGKLSDMYGRKYFFMGGLIVFMLGSLLCGIATSMDQLIWFRVIQGIGGGALIPIAFTIVFDIFPPRERGKMTGLFGMVFGISSVFGPLLGAFITDSWGWHWIFFINIPFGLLSFVLIYLNYKENPKHEKKQIDWLGALTLVGFVVSFMLALEYGGSDGWGASKVIGLFVLAFALLVVFLVTEARVKEPIITYALFKNRLFAGSQIAAFFYGAIFAIPTIFLPLYIALVFNVSTTSTGLLLLPLMVGSIVGAQFSGRLIARFRYKQLMYLSGTALLLGTVALSTITPDTARWLVSTYMVLQGFGVGMTFSLLSTASVHNIPIDMRGTASSTNTFFRSIGMTIGATIFGTLQKSMFNERLSDVQVGSSGFQPSADSFQALISNPELMKTVPPHVIGQMIQEFANSISSLFVYGLIVVALAWVGILWMNNASAKEMMNDEQTPNVAH
ncbi:MAG: MDR family MFS transporter [Bacilli bacterium]